MAGSTIDYGDLLTAIAARVATVVLVEGEGEDALTIADFSVEGAVRYGRPPRQWDSLPVAFVYLSTWRSLEDSGRTLLGERDERFVVGIDMGVSGTGSPESGHLRVVRLWGALRAALADWSWLDAAADALELREVAVAFAPGQAVGRGGAGVLLADLSFDLPQDGGGLGA